MSEPVKMMIMLTAAQGRKNELRQVFEKFVTMTQTEPGCLEFALHESTDDDHVLIITEHWASQEPLQAHFEGAAVGWMRTQDTSKLVTARQMHHLRRLT